MKKYSWFVFVLIVMLCMGGAGCKRDGDVLATYKGGSITRGDFYTWLPSDENRKKSILQSKTNQKHQLQKMVEDRIAVIEAKKGGLDKDPMVQKKIALESEKQLMMYYEREIFGKTEYAEQVSRLSQIYFRIDEFKTQDKKRVRLSKEELDAAFGKLMAKAQGVLKELKDNKFEDLAKKYSDDYSKTNGGDIGMKMREMLPDEYAKVVDALKEGEVCAAPVKVYSETPNRMANGVYIIKVTDREKVSLDNVDKFITKKQAAPNFKRQLILKAQSKYIENLEKAKDVVNAIEKGVGDRGAEVLFRVGAISYTNDDLNQRIKLLLDIYNARYQRFDIKITDAIKKNLAKNMFQYYLLKRDADQKGIVKGPEFKALIDRTADMVLAMEYLSALSSKSLSVTEAEMRDEYEKNKQRYTKGPRMGMNPKAAPKGAAEIEPYENVKKRIEMQLIGKKRNMAVQTWKNRVAKEYEIKINDDKFEGK